MRRNPKIRLLAALLVSAIAGTASAQHEHHGGAGKAASNASCAGNDLKCAATATPAFSPDGAVWVAWAAAGKVWAARSRDLGRTFEAPVAVTPTAPQLPLDNGPDARPRIVVGGDGALTVSFATRDPHYNGHAFVARSTDGRAFAAAREITEHSPSQRFETVALDADGRAFAAWIDKRNAASAKKAGAKYAGAALAFAWSDKDGAGFAPARIARDNTCECCRIGVGFLGPGRPVVIFRNIFEGGVRDHAVIVFDGPGAPGPVRRVATDGWQTDACPHHGPSLAVASSGTLHATWFTSGKVLKGLYYAFSRDEGATFSAPRQIGNPARQTSRPFVLAEAGATWLVWKEFDGERTEVVAQVSRDDGATWSAPQAVAGTREASDHPLLVAHGGKVYLSWLTRQEGYRLVELGAAS